MEVLLTGAQAKAADEYSITQIGMASAALMERAALAVARKVINKLPHAARTKVLSVCGTGNNGGDGIAAARLLLLKGYRAEVFLNGDINHITQECARQLAIFRRLGGCVQETAETFDGYDVIIDALTGAGLRGNVREQAAEVIRRVNAAGAYVVSVDIPSGVIADNGHVGAAAVKADETVTFSYYKRGHVLYPGRGCCGKITLEDVGLVLPEHCESGETENMRAFALTKEDALRLLPPRYARSNKGTYGKALLVCGQKNMAGAALMAVRAALRSGAGLVMSVSDSENRNILQTAVPEALFCPWDEADTDTKIRHWASTVGCGCGLGTGGKAKALVEKVLACDAKTVILDADALNVIAQSGTWPVHEDKKIIITPHPGEMSRLCGKSIKEILDDPVGTAVEYAKRHDLIVVLKDAATVITDGSRICINRTGCPGMSTGGSGDVLAGLMAGISAQGADAFDAAALSVYLHGEAGEAAQSRLSAYAMTAMDIADALEHVFTDLVGEERNNE